MNTPNDSRVGPDTLHDGAPAADGAGHEPPHTADVVVVGAGLSGLAAAAHLTGSGYRVALVESAPAVGGRVRTETIAGHRFDTGATVLTMPELVERTLAATTTGETTTGATFAESVALTPIDPTYHVRFADGTDVDIARDPESLSANITATFGEREGQAHKRLRRWLADLFDVEFDTFVDRNADGVLDYLDATSRGATMRLLSMGALAPLEMVIRRFIHDERLRRVFTFQALYAGVAPSRAPGVYALIAHMDIGMGVWYPRGGMGAIADTIAEHLVREGCSVSLNTPVDRVIVRGDTVGGVELSDGRVIDARAVVLTTDTPVTETLMRESTAARRRRRRRRVHHSPSAVVVHGLVREDLARSWPARHHTIVFGDAWAQTFSEITGRRGTLMSDPSLLITRPAQSDPATFVRDGYESISVLAPCPNLDSADLPWDQLAPAYAREVLATLADRGYAGIDEHLEIVRIDHPLTWSRAGMSAGTPFAAAHRYSQTGPFRTPNVWPGIPGVVLAGSSTVPGVGIPPVLVSGRLAAERVAAVLGSAHGSQPSSSAAGGR